MDVKIGRTGMQALFCSSLAPKPLPGLMRLDFKNFVVIFHTLFPVRKKKIQNNCYTTCCMVILCNSSDFWINGYLDFCGKMSLSEKILIAIVLPSLIVNAFEIHDCSGKNALAKLKKVTIEGCPIGTPDKYCPLIRGQNADIDVEFETGMFFRFHGLIYLCSHSISTN